MLLLWNSRCHKESCRNDSQRFSFCLKCDVTKSCLVFGAFRICFPGSCLVLLYMAYLCLTCSWWFLTLEGCCSTKFHVSLEYPLSSCLALDAIKLCISRQWLGPQEQGSEKIEHDSTIKSKGKEHLIYRANTHVYSDGWQFYKLFRNGDIRYQLRL